MNRLTYLVLFLMTSFMVGNSAFGAPKLSWDPSTGDVKGYKIHYGETSGSYTKQLDVGNSVECALSDLTLNDNRKYFFSVTAYSDAGVSDYSNEISWESGDSTPPITPQGFSVGVEPGQATLSWQPNAEDDLNGYNAYCGESSRTYSPPIPVGKIAKFTMTNIEEGKQYYFAITATDTSGNESGYSSEIIKTIPEYPVQNPIPPGSSPGKLIGINPSQYPSQWLDTKAANSMAQDDNLFKVFDVEGSPVFGTTSTRQNIHSHYIGPESDISNHEYTGKMMITSDRGGIGVTFLSQYPNEDAYYRLRRYDSKSFHIAPHPNGRTLSGDIDTGVVPVPDTWYRFKILVFDTGTQTEIKARVWEDEASEPSNWQVDAYDSKSDRLTQGKFGVWSDRPGSKYWDKIQVSHNASQYDFPQEDTISPEITITYPAVNHVSQNDYISLSGTASDNVEISTISWINSAGGSGEIGGEIEWQISNIGLKAGDNVITVTATDGAGNEGTDEIQVTFTAPDTTAPTVAIKSPTIAESYTTQNSTINLSGTASDNILLNKVIWSTSAGDSGTAVGTTNWSIPNIPLQLNDNEIQVIALDDASNQSVATIRITHEPPISLPPSNALDNIDPSRFPDQWMDTRAGNSMAEDDRLFKTFDIDENKVFGTTSTRQNIHSHYIGPESDISNHEYTGKMMITSGRGGIGVTFLSQYPNEDAYYRLRRYDSKSFHIAPHPNGRTMSGDIDTGVAPVPDTWYRFKILVFDTGTQTEIKARVWEDGASEPSNWQVDAYDSKSDRLTRGKFGIWSDRPGSKYWDDIRISKSKQ